MPFGYHGKILHVHLDSQALNFEEPGEDFYRKSESTPAPGKALQSQSCLPSALSAASHFCFL